MMKKIQTILFVLSICLNCFLAYMVYQDNLRETAGGVNFKNANGNALLARDTINQIDNNSNSFMKQKAVYTSIKIIDDAIIELEKLNYVNHNHLNTKENDLLVSLYNLRDSLNMYISPKTGTDIISKDDLVDILNGTINMHYKKYPN